MSETIRCDGCERDYPVTDGLIRFCNSCGRQYPHNEQHKFCGRCGVPLAIGEVVPTEKTQ